MEESESIGKYFTPIQPSVSGEDGNVVYKELKPDIQLQNHIHCYWQLSTKRPLSSPFNYRVVSDGCIDVFFNLKNTTESSVMGFCNKYTEFPIGKEFNFGGIRFYPSMFPQIFGISAKTFSEKAQSLESILPDLAEFISTNIVEDFPLSIIKFDKFFDSLIQHKVPNVDERFHLAFLEILKEKGNLEIEHQLNTGISPRQLRRLFNFYIGTSPKSFSQVVRFQYILGSKPSIQSLKENKIFYDVGFFDQAHFIKEFKKQIGQSPKQYRLERQRNHLT